jgi:beta-lactamase superfamily II metal-dependent hydrolase
MLFHLPNGKFIIYDGGYTANDGLYKKLKELAGNNDIIIASWIISHPHPDHEDAFDAFLKNHAKDIRIETVMYNFTKLSDAYGTSDTIKPYVEQYLDGKTTIIKPHTGQIYTFGSSTVEILHTVEDFMPAKISDVNYATMVVRVTVAGKSTILLGDAYDDVAPFLTKTYGSYLKSDMVQLAHHGTYPGTTELYSAINAPILFWPSSADNVKSRYNSSGHESLRKAISIAKDVYLASEGTVTLTIPHTLENNKDAFLKRMGLK